MSGVTIHHSFLPHLDAEASLAFWRDALGFEVRQHVEYEGMHWITVGPPDQPATSIVLAPPAADPGITDEERRTITEMMAKGTYGIVVLATADLEAVFGRLQAAACAEVVRSRPISRGGCATAPSATPRAPWSASTSSADPRECR